MIRIKYDKLILVMFFFIAYSTLICEEKKCLTNQNNIQIFQESLNVPTSQWPDVKNIVDIVPGGKIVGGNLTTNMNRSTGAGYSNYNMTWQIKWDCEPIQKSAHLYYIRKDTTIRKIKKDTSFVYDTTAYSPIQITVKDISFEGYCEINCNWEISPNKITIPCNQEKVITLCPGVNRQELEYTWEVPEPLSIIDGSIKDRCINVKVPEISNSPLIVRLTVVDNICGKVCSKEMIIYREPSVLFEPPKCLCRNNPNIIKHYSKKDKLIVILKNPDHFKIERIDEQTIELIPLNSAALNEYIEYNIETACGIFPIRVEETQIIDGPPSIYPNLEIDPMYPPYCWGSLLRVTYLSPVSPLPDCIDRVETRLEGAFVEEGKDSLFYDYYPVHGGYVVLNPKRDCGYVSVRYCNACGCGSWNTISFCYQHCNGLGGRNGENEHGNKQFYKKSIFTSNNEMIWNDTEKLYINLDSESRILLFNLLGDKINEIPNASGKYEISILNLPSGIYIVNISNKNGINRYKIIKE